MAWILRVAAVAALLAAGSRRGDPIVLEAGKIRLGDDKGDRLSWSVKVPELPALPDGQGWALRLVMNDVEPANKESFEGGSYHDDVKIDGRAVTTLNAYAEADKKGDYEAWVPLPGLRSGSELEFVAGIEVGGKNHDDFSIANLRLAPMRRAAVRVKLDGEAGPAKLMVKGAERLGPDFDASGAGRAVYTTTGEAAFWVPADARVRVTASHGPEFTVAEGEIGEGPLALDLRRAVETPGMIGADFHLHATPSGDSRVPLAGRVATCAAEGLEFVVATDHNRATDYGPAIRDLKLEGRLGASMGDEITTYEPAMGHFNAFPLTGVVDPGKLDPALLVDRVRAATKGPHVLQVNHPRDGDIGYFTIFKLNSETGVSADPKFHLKFDAIEVFNGLSGSVQMARVLQDWINLLNVGVRITATGNSDSHMAVQQDAGWPRNYVIVGHDRLPTEDEVVEAVRKHRVMVSSGPILRVTDASDANLIGEERKGPLKARIRLSAAPWVEVGKATLFEDGKALREWKVDGPLDETVELRAKHWYFVTAEGGRYAADVVSHGRVRPWAFTNPVWVVP